MTDKELMQMTLDALEKISMGGHPDWADDVIPLLRTRLSQCERCGKVNPAEIHTCTPKREWYGLTDEECLQNPYCAGESDVEVIQLARAIEAKLREKNI